MRKVYIDSDSLFVIHFAFIREDGREALKFYTDPKYFFELWCQEMQKNIQDIRQKRKKRVRIA